MTQNSITATATFRARLLRSEMRRAWLMTGVWGISLTALEIRRVLHDTVISIDELYYLALGLLGFAIAFEVGSALVCRRWLRIGGHMPMWYSGASALVEVGIVISGMAILDALSPLGEFEALSAPILLGFPMVTMLSILRLKPWLSLGVGFAGAVAHWALVVHAIRASQIDVHEWPMLFQYGVWMAITGIGAALIAHHARRAVIESVEESQAAERTERALAMVERDMAVAQEIQAGLMPSDSPAIAGFDIAGMARPAAKAGGDYYDWQPMADGRLVVALADVTGHGIGPALVMAVCRSYARASAPAAPDPATLLSSVNGLIYDDLSRTGRFITMAIAILSPDGTVDLVSAGHGPTLLYRAATGEVETFGGDGVPLGVIEGETYGPNRRFRMDAGDVLMLMTDGYMEWARAGDGRMFGIDGLTSTAKALAAGSAQSILKGLDDAVVAFAQGSEQMDDTTAVVVKRM